jgi:AcrR family transcriptional regulator
LARQVRAEETKAAIIRGAAEAFDRLGYGATSLTDVIKLAGVTKGALYFHFSSKQDVARAVIECQHARSIGPARERAEAAVPALEAVVELSFGLATQLVDDPIVRAGIRLTLETGTFDAGAATPYRDWIDAIETLLHRAVETGDVRTSVRPESVARFVVGAFTGVHLVSQVLTGRQDVHERVREMWELLLPSLVPEGKLTDFRDVIATAESRQRTR